MQVRELPHRLQIFRENTPGPIGALIQKYLVQDRQGCGHFGWRCHALFDHATPKPALNFPFLLQRKVSFLLLPG